MFHRKSKMINIKRAYQCMMYIAKKTLLSPEVCHVSYMVLDMGFLGRGLCQRRLAPIVAGMRVGVDHSRFV